jgi:cysteine-S-conjugate beta-lyase
MKYDFDRVIDRRNTDSCKWAENEKRFGDKDALSLWVADMDFESPAPVIHALRERVEQGIFGYPIRRPSYYAGMIDWMFKRHDWKVQESWFAFSPGVVCALNVALHAYTQPGDKVIIQPPVYPPFFSSVLNNGRQLVFNPLRVENGEYRMDFDNLEKQIDARTKMLILCSPHNPVGRVWKREELLQLGEICLKKGVLILSDEIHLDLIFRGHKHIPIAMLSEELAQNTITVIAPSKTFNIAGLYASSAIIPNPRLRAAFNTARDNFGIDGGNIFGYVALEAAYNSGEEWLAQLMEYLEDNLDFLIDYMQKHIPQIKPVRPEGMHLVWLDCRGLGLDPASLKEFILKKARVALNDGPTFGKQGEGFQRMNFACPRSVLLQALQRIERACERIKSG